MVKAMWMVRAGRGGIYAADFLDNNYVGIGWRDGGDPTAVTDKADLVRRFASAWPEATEQSRFVSASIVFRFVREVSVGDDVITYDPAIRTYHTGVIASGPEWSGDPEDYRNTQRRVTWSGTVLRDRLGVAARNTLGATLTLFLLPPAVAEEIRTASAEKDTTNLVSEQIAAAPDGDLFADIADVALERIKDRIVRLDWEQMQELVAALLRSMGYQTRISPRGADRGRDILASPDAFGFTAPRITVEVKHRPKESMGAPHVRALAAGSHADDRCLFVSTGGFGKEAKYEAERSRTIITLMNLDDLARAIIEAYPRFDEQGRTLLPLTRMYWPS